jgi:hypothetical protein
MYREPEIKLKQYQMDAINRRLAKLKALEDGGVVNWEYYTYSLRHWQYAVDQEDLIQGMIGDINDLMTEADVDQPAGSGCGYSISFDEAQMAKYLKDFLVKYTEIENGKPSE